MRLFNPAALWFLILVPVLVFLYILKQRFEEKEVPSLYLWQQVLMDSEATSPFQRLRKSILFFLQLLLILFLIFALANPFLWWKNKDYENLVLVMDTTGSMSALGVKESKLEEAKEKAVEIINSLPRGSKITVISSARSCRVEVSGTSDKIEAAQKIKSLRASNSTGNMEDSYSLVKSICSQYESYQVVYLTDKDADLKDLNGQVVVMPSKKNNLSLDFISQTKTADGLKVLIRTTNRGNEESHAEICLYGEDKLVTLTDTSILPGETKTLYFNKVPQNIRYLKAEITEKDSLQEDNSIFSIVKQKEQKKILLSTEKNVFLEKVLAAMRDVEVYKTAPGEKIENDFDLYIYDNNFPKELPKKGSILFINASENNSLFTLSSEIQGGKAEIQSHGITKYMTNSDFIISKFRSINVPYWGNSLIGINDKSAAFAGEFKGQRIGVLSFDLHNTDFPLTPEFPIFINNTLSYLVDREALGKDDYNCGDSIEITPLPDAEKITILDPLRNTVDESSEYPVKPYDKTFIPGIYEILQKIGDRDSSKLVAINFPTEESKLAEASEGSSSIRNSEKSRGGINLNNFLIASAFLIMLVEWIIYLKLYGSREARKPKGKGGASWG